MKSQIKYGLTRLNDRWIEKSGGKSEHQRAGRSITWSHGDVKESATESRPPLYPFGFKGKGETVR